MTLLDQREATPLPVDAGVTVVVAVWGSLSALEECVHSLGQQRDAGVQVLIVSAVPLPSDLSERHPWCELIQAPSTHLIPQLWAGGIAHARHPIVAITTAHFVPAQTYVAAMRRAHARLDAAGIGGRIDPRSDGDSITWATYFLRYSAYLSWDSERSVTDFAGDNGSYKSGALLSVSAPTDEGFWEQQIHRRLVAAGRKLAYVPEIAVTQHASFGVLPFCRQRFRHGTVFGRERVVGATVATRLLRVCSAPAIPVVLLTKVIVRVLKARRYLWPFVRCLPVLLLFVLAWSAGEICGYVTGAKSALATSPRIGAPSA